MKKILSIFIVLTLMFTCMSFTFASNLELKVDGVNKNLNTETVNARTFVSADSLKDFGLTSSSNGNSVILKNSKVEFEFTINSNKVNVNKVPFTLDCNSYKKNDKYYVPFRFVLETMNYNITWDSKTKSIIANKGTDSKFPVKLVAGDNTYSINSEAKTIVSLAPGVTEKLFAIGAGDRIKGRTKYCDYPEAASSIENIGSLYTPNLEGIIDINPDVVIAETHFKKEVLDKMNEAGIATFATSSPNNIEGIYEFTLKLGEIVNKNYEARALVSSMKAKVSRVKYELSTVKETDKPTVYYVVGTGEYGEYTAGKGTFISDMIKVAGGKNVADDVEGWSYSLEKLIDHNPKIIFGGNFNIETMLSSDNYKGLSSITNKTYKKVDENIISRPGPRAIDEGLKKLVEIFHNSKLKNLGF